MTGKQRNGRSCSGFAKDLRVMKSITVGKSPKDDKLMNYLDIRSERINIRIRYSNWIIMFLISNSIK